MCESQSLSPSLKAKEFISLSGRESWKAVERTAVTVFEVERALLTHASLTLTVALGKNKDKPKSLLVTYWLFHCCASTKTPVSFPYCQDSHLVCPRLRFWRFSWQPDLYNALCIYWKRKRKITYFSPFGFCSFSLMRNQAWGDATLQSGYDCSRFIMKDSAIPTGNINRWDARQGECLWCSLCLPLSTTK